MARFQKFSVPEYHRLRELGLLTEKDNIELLEGYPIHKMVRNAATTMRYSTSPIC